VPFTWTNRDRELLAQLSGVSLPARASIAGTSFDESLLFTHRGLSGPVILQISSYWQDGKTVEINLLPSDNLADILQLARRETPRLRLKTLLGRLLPARFVETVENHWFQDRQLGQLPKADAETLVAHIHRWQFRPGGSEGYRTAEVTLGGVDTDALSSKTLACKTIPNLYFIGEAVDVTGHLGGHNFQWAWASAYAAAQAIAEN
jgi:predicted Rossmann fold flavoprotein